MAKPNGDEIAPAAFSAWLTEQAIPLSAVQAGHGFADLEALRPILENVRVVGLGEATHGSREFFQMKHRLVEFLVSELGFSAFLLEASYAACMNINAYVLRGEGDRAAALASQGFWTWDTEEVSDLIDWIYAYNQTQPDEWKVKFLGYDVQRVNDAIAYVRAFLSRVAPGVGQQAEPVFNLLWVDDTSRPSAPMVPDDLTRAQLLATLYSLIGYLTTHRIEIARATSADEWHNAVEYAKNILRYYDSYVVGWGDRHRGFAKRDTYMAQTIEELLEGLGPEAKVIVWAHNGHITTHPYLAGVTAMGGHLRAAFGDAYYPIGFTFNQGGFQSRQIEGNMENFTMGPLIEFNVGPAPEGYLEWHFAQADLGVSFVDLRGVNAPWLEMSFPTRSIGAGFSEDPADIDDYTLTNPLNEYDGLIYIPSTTRARPTPTGVRA